MFCSVLFCSVPSCALQLHRLAARRDSAWHVWAMILQRTLGVGLPFALWPNKRVTGACGRARSRLIGGLRLNCGPSMVRQTWPVRADGASRNGHRRRALAPLWPPALFLSARFSRQPRSHGHGHGLMDSWSSFGPPTVNHSIYLSISRTVVTPPPKVLAALHSQPWSQFIPSRLSSRRCVSAPCRHHHARTRFTSDAQ
jgi:hypothetical protein